MRLIQRHTLRIKFLLVLILLVSSCSMVAVAYNKFDWFLLWEVNKYIDTDADQERYISQAADDLIVWHKTSELPRYKAFLTGLRDMASDSMTSAEVDSVFLGFRQGIVALLDAVSDEAAEFLVTLTPEQITSLDERIERTNRKRADEEAEDDSHRKRIRRIHDRVEYWVGSLHEEQSTWLESFAKGIPSTTKYWPEHRLKRRQSFVAILRSTDDVEEKKSKIRDWIKSPEDGRSEEYIQLDTRVRKEYAEFVIQLDRRINASQRLHFKNKIEEFIRITENLANK